MRCIIQRVTNSSVTINNELCSKIEKGLLIYLAILDSDNEDTIKKIVKKIVNMRIFPDSHQKMNLSILDKKYSILVISQFTLYADCKKGNRPFFGNAAKPEHAEKIYSNVIKELNKYTICKSGKFGENMQITSVNTGPVTIIIDSNTF